MKKKTQDYSTTQGQHLLRFFNTYIRAARWVEDMAWHWYDDCITDTSGTISIFPGSSNDCSNFNHGRVFTAVYKKDVDNQQSRIGLLSACAPPEILGWLREAAIAQGVLPNDT